jgi:signal transduction histidine kinase
MRERERLLRSLITAQEEERRRVARELHDELGQDLSGTAIRIENARRAIARDPQAAFDLLEQAQSTIAEATERMYDMILGLRPSVLDDLGLAAALRTQCQRTLEPAGIAFELETLGLSDRLPPEIETVLFRISQEALTNVLRHAKAGNVRLRLSRNENTVEAEIQDDGIGFDPSDFAAFGDEHGLGLLGMRERVEQFGGTIEIQSRPGAGSRIRVILTMSSDVHV